MIFNKTEALLKYPQINPVVLLVLPNDEARYQVEHIHDNRVGEGLASQFICLAIAVISVALRLISRRIIKAPYKADDWLILVSLVAFICFISLVLLCVLKYGAARHAILLHHPIKLGQVVLAIEMCYGVSITAAKLSMACLLGRLFPSRNLHRVLWGIGIFVVAYWLPFSLVTIFQCRPIKAAWDLSPNAKCIDVKKIWMVCAALHAATDVALIVAPMPFVWRLRAPISTKIALMALFCVGGFVTIVSIYRIPLLQHITLNDASWTDIDSTIWTAVEASVAIFCACAVTYRPLVHKTFGIQHKPVRAGDDLTFIRSPEMSNSGWTRFLPRKFSYGSGLLNHSAASPAVKHAKSFDGLTDSSCSDSHSWTNKRKLPFTISSPVLQQSPTPTPTPPPPPPPSQPRFHKFSPLLRQTPLPPPPVAQNPVPVSTFHPRIGQERRRGESSDYLKRLTLTPPPPPPAWTKPANLPPPRKHNNEPRPFPPPTTTTKTTTGNNQTVPRKPVPSTWNGEVHSRNDNSCIDVPCPRDYYEIRGVRPNR